MRLPAQLRDRRDSALAHLLLAGIAYIPFLLSRPGDVSADTKQYLYLDPGRLLSRAVYLWDPNVGAGYVPHQNIGYLYPMGPYYWLLQQLSIPDWVAQRLWLGSISFAAGAGVLFLFRTLGPLRLRGALVAALVYMLTPYQLAYTARISAILLPWAGLPWLIALTIRSVRNGGWRYPAIFALATLTVGGTNATSLLFAGLGPAIWLVVAVTTNETTLRRAAAATARIGALVLATSFWWISGLASQARYGLNVLDYSETVRVVSQGSSPTEVLRGLGNWFFYGGDAAGPWIDHSIDFTQRHWLLLVSFALPVLGLAAAVLLRWKHRLYFGLLVVVGTVIAVGANPYDDPTPLGGLFKSFATGSTVGLALRSTPRAVPLLALGFACLLGAAIAALARFGRWGVVAAVLAGGLAVVNFVPVWRDGYIPQRLARPEHVPSYWVGAGTALDHQGGATRALEIPGSDFAAYRWGDTVDDITPGLTARPILARELIPYTGSPATANLLIALDHRLQEGTFEPSSLAPVARMVNAGTVLLRSDLQYERYNTPRPRALWGQLTNPTPPGLGNPQAFGPPTVNLAPPGVLIDDIELRTAPNASWPPPVALFGVHGAPPIVNAAATARPVIVAGDGEALVDAAAAGILDGHELVQYAGTLDRDPAALERALRAGADLVVSDTNRRRAQRWGTVRDTTGYTERAGEKPLVVDTDDHRLDVFPGTGDDARTVAEQGGATVAATRYGQTTVYRPDDRPVHAFDGDATTAWRVAGEDDPTGQRLVIALRHSVTTDHINLVQPLTGQNDRYLTKVRLHFDHGAPLTVALDERSRTAAGQKVDFSRRRIRRLTVELLDTNLGRRADYAGVNGVGFAEVRIGDVHADEVVRLPVDLLNRVGRASLQHRLVVMMSRLRYEPGARFRQDEEPWLARTFELPTGRQFSLGGTMRVDPNAPDDTLDGVLGTVAPGTTYRASAHLIGDTAARASRAFDANPSTAWSAPIGSQEGQWIEAQLSAPTTVDHLDLVIVADGHHSVPTRLRLESDGQSRSISLPPIADQARPGATVTAPVSFAPVTGTRMRLTIDSVRPVTAIDYHSRTRVPLPVAIAETGMPGVPLPSASRAPAAACRSDLLTVDGRPVAVRPVGPESTAASDGALALEPCAGALTLPAGHHTVRSRPGRTTGLDIDRVVLASDRGGRALGSPRLSTPRGTAAAHVRVVSSGPTSFDLKAHSDGSPFWLVLGQSFNGGWHADATSASIGPDRLVNGYANAWLVDPKGRHDVAIRLRWTPQRTVWFGLALSVIGVIVCLVLAFTRRRRNGAAAADPAPTLESRLAADTPVVSTRAAVAIVLGAGLFAALASRPLLGGVVAVATAAALRWRRGRALLRVGAVGAFSLSALYVLFEQWRHHFPAVGTWPANFDDVADLTWLAVTLLAADLVITWVAQRRRGAHDPDQFAEHVQP